MPTAIRRLRLRYGSAHCDLVLARLRSGSAHCDLALAVEVRHCSLRSGACSRGGEEAEEEGRKEGRKAGR